jgi:phenylacetate-coenzyme A ligase PaaK-like adenylate-forming protein
VKIGNDEIYPSIFDEVLFSIPDIIDYQVTLSKERNKDILTFKVEVVDKGDKIQKAITEKLLSHPIIVKNLRAEILELAPIELVDQGNLTRINRAKKLITNKHSTTS